MHHILDSEKEGDDDYNACDYNDSRNFFGQDHEACDYNACDYNDSRNFFGRDYNDSRNFFGRDYNDSRNFFGRDHEPRKSIRVGVQFSRME